MKVAITGADGFFGRHLSTRMKAAGCHTIVGIPRQIFSAPFDLATVLADVDAVVHLAGINRAEPAVIESGNPRLAKQLVTALEAADRTPVIFFANSVHAGSDTPYGRGKRRALEVLESWAGPRGGQIVNVVYQHLFGESGRPDYNSFVATFCDRLASGRHPEIVTNRSLELIHAQTAAQTLIDILDGPGPIQSRMIETHGVATTVCEVRDRLMSIADIYVTGSFPDLGDPYTRQLFNTYRSFLFPSHYPFSLTRKTDRRGFFVESVRSLGGQSQASYSTTEPGVTRGNHFHLEKVERFLVVKGQARIRVRPVYGTEIHHFDVSGDAPAFVDIPTLHTHDITNVGDEELYTLFWSDEIYDPARPDTFMEEVS